MTVTAFSIGLALLVAVSLASLKNPRIVPARASLMTLLWFDHHTPGPWPSGNSFWLAPRPHWIMRGLVGKYMRHYAPNCFSDGPDGWAVINMHAENFKEIVKRLKLESVEIVVLDQHSCLVVDSRIPREWFRPLLTVGNWSLTAQQTVAAYSDRFSQPAPTSETH